MNFRDYDCIVDGTIEQCIEEIEVGDLEDHIYYGPQADIMEKLILKLIKKFIVQF